jgi:hypothetical protein
LQARPRESSARWNEKAPLRSAMNRAGWRARCGRPNRRLRGRRGRPGGGESYQCCVICPGSAALPLRPINSFEP